MKKTNPFIIPLIVLLVGIALDSFAGSVTLSEPRIEGLLSDAGFKILTEPAARQEVWYTRSAPHRLERHMAGGRIIYTYADWQGGFLYIGDQFSYRQYERLLGETLVAETQVQATVAFDHPCRDWDWTWEPWLLPMWSYQPGNQ